MWNHEFHFSDSICRNTEQKMGGATVMSPIGNALLKWVATHDSGVHWGQVQATSNLCLQYSPIKSTRTKDRLHANLPNATHGSATEHLSSADQLINVLLNHRLIFHSQVCRQCTGIWKVLKFPENRQRKDFWFNVISSVFPMYIVLMAHLMPSCVLNTDLM